MDKKAMKKQYKETVQPMGVFKIVCKANNKIFIVGSLNMRARMTREKFQLDMGSHRNEELQNDYKEYGKEAFEFEVVDNLKPKEDPAYNYTDDLVILEEMWIEKLQSYGEKGYNKKPVK